MLRAGMPRTAPRFLFSGSEICGMGVHLYTRSRSTTWLALMSTAKAQSTQMPPPNPAHQTLPARALLCTTGVVQGSCLPAVVEAQAVALRLPEPFPLTQLRSVMVVKQHPHCIPHLGCTLLNFKMILATTWPYLAWLSVLGAICAAVYYRNRVVSAVTTSGALTSALGAYTLEPVSLRLSSDEFTSFQRLFLVVYLTMMMADWMQVSMRGAPFSQLTKALTLTPPPRAPTSMRSMTRTGFPRAKLGSCLSWALGLRCSLAQSSAALPTATGARPTACSLRRSTRWVASQSTGTTTRSL